MPGFGERRVSEARGGRGRPHRDQVSHFQQLGDTVSGTHLEIAHDILRGAQGKMENKVIHRGSAGWQMGERILGTSYR